MTAKENVPQEPSIESGSQPDPDEVPRVLDAVKDQFGGRWVKFGTIDAHRWLSIQQFQINEKQTFSLLADINVVLLTTTSRNKFKKNLEAIPTYRAALVASRPGWLDRHHVFGDGDVIAPPGDKREVIVAFEPDPKFTPKGSFKRWKKGIGPLVTNQPLPLFSVSFACVGPLLKFVRPHRGNPHVKVVGEPESGKTSLAIVLASTWAGDPESDVGGAETWDFKLNYLDRLKLKYSDATVAVDETNLAGTDEREQAELLGRATFKIAAAGGKKRQTDTQQIPNVRFALFSTGNDTLGQLTRGSLATQHARDSRVLTISLSKDRPYGVLDSVPDGFSSSQDAIDHVRSAVGENYGKAGRIFIKRLVRACAKDEAGVSAQFQRRMNSALKWLREDGLDCGSARHRMTLALTYAAGRCARDLGILPEKWGSLKAAILEVATMVSGSRPVNSPLDRILNYAEKHRQHIVRIKSLGKPLDRASFDKTPGFRRRKAGMTELLIPSGVFQAEFPNYREVMTMLRAQGLAKTEIGDQPKLTIKAPKSLCKTGRVYCILLPGDGVSKSSAPPR